MRLRGLIFDLDGTLLNSLPVCYSGFRSTLRKFLGREYSDAEIKTLFGPTEEGVLKNCCLVNGKKGCNIIWRPMIKPIQNMPSRFREWKLPWLY